MSIRPRSRINKISQRVFFLVALLIFSQISMAQTDVVIIPMFEEDQIYLAQPSAPVTADNRGNLGFFSFNGLVFDTQTGLAWQKSDDGIERSWEDAVEYCDQLNLANQSRWRLPTVNELYSIMELGEAGPLINQDVFNITTPLPLFGRFWTSELNRGKATSRATSFRTVSFETGITGALADIANNESLVRCVL